MRRPQGRGLELARKHIAYCISELDSVLESEEFLRLNIVENGGNEMEESTTASGRSPIGFDPTLNKRLSAPTPPRAIKLLSWKKVGTSEFSVYNVCIKFFSNFFQFLIFQAIDYYVKLLHNLDQICVFSLEPDLEAVLQFVIKFQKSSPDLVARAHLQVPYYTLTHQYLAALCFQIPIHHFLFLVGVNILAVVAWMFTYIH